MSIVLYSQQWQRRHGESSPHGSGRWKDPQRPATKRAEEGTEVCNFLLVFPHLKVHQVRDKWICHSRAPRDECEHHEQQLSHSLCTPSDSQGERKEREKAKFFGVCVMYGYIKFSAMARSCFAVNLRGNRRELNAVGEICFETMSCLSGKFWKAQVW